MPAQFSEKQERQPFRWLGRDFFESEATILQQNLHFLIFCYLPTAIEALEMGIIGHRCLAQSFALSPGEESQVIGKGMSPQTSARVKRYVMAGLIGWTMRLTMIVFLYWVGHSLMHIPLHEMRDVERRYHVPPAVVVSDKPSVSGENLQIKAAAKEYNHRYEIALQLYVLAHFFDFATTVCVQAGLGSIASMMIFDIMRFRITRVLWARKSAGC